MCSGLSLLYCSLGSWLEIFNPKQMPLVHRSRFGETDQAGPSIFDLVSGSTRGRICAYAGFVEARVPFDSWK